MTWMDEGMEPFPNQQPIPPVPAVPEDAPVVKAVPGLCFGMFALF